MASSPGPKIDKQPLADPMDFALEDLSIVPPVQCESNLATETVPSLDATSFAFEKSAKQTLEVPLTNKQRKLLNPEINTKGQSLETSTEKHISRPTRTSPLMKRSPIGPANILDRYIAILIKALKLLEKIITRSGGNNKPVIRSSKIAISNPHAEEPVSPGFKMRKKKRQTLANIE